MEEGGAWINIADVLHLAGRTEEALDTARSGLESAHTRDWRTTDWLRLATSEYSFHLGDWDEAEKGIPAASRRHTGGTLLLWQTCRAQLALGRGDTETAEDAIAILRQATAELVEPQFVGTAAALFAELLVRRGEIEQARAAIDDAIDRIEFCSEDVPRMRAARGGRAPRRGRRRRGRPRPSRRGGRGCRARARRRAARARPLQRPSRAGGPRPRSSRGRRRSTRVRSARRSTELWAAAAEPGTSCHGRTRRRTPAGARRRRSWPSATATAPPARPRRRSPARAGSAAPGSSRRSSRSPPARA